MARSPDITRREIDVIGDLLPMGYDDRILDLCGGHGRHTLELCRRGYKHCTVLDYSKTLLRIGAQNADRQHYTVKFVQGDARGTRLPSRSFDHVLILGNSLGYITDPESDLLILKESRRLLKQGGWLLLDVTDGDAVRANLAHTAWHEIDEDVVVCRQREVQENRVCAREMVLSKDRGMVRDATYCIRLYDAQGLETLMVSAGFNEISVHTMSESKDPKADLGCMNNRLLAAARRP